MGHGLPCTVQACDFFQSESMILLACIEISYLFVISFLFANTLRRQFSPLANRSKAIGVFFNMLINLWK